MSKNTQLLLPRAGEGAPKGRMRVLFFLTLFAVTAHAQTSIEVTVDPNKAAQVIRIAVPFPDVTIPRNAPPDATMVDPEAIRASFFGPLTRDIAYSGIFAIAPMPPNVPITPDVLKSQSAQLLLRLNVFQQGADTIVDASLLDSAGSVQPLHRYRAPGAASLALTAHMLANDLLRVVNGKPGVFRTMIAFASNRSGHWEIWLMDWDGANQRRITNHNALTILPSWAPDNERMVYTSFMAGTSDMYIVNRRGGGRIRLKTGLNLNTSATFSPVGNDIAFVGSVAGNPDIYVIKDDGTNLRRLTTSSSIESTPEWSPNGGQISFTSGRSGTPQIYVMDAEGTNVRRISYDGDWNDDATWSPNGASIAYTSRVNGRFQIRITDPTSGDTHILAGEGSNEQPSWSPDGQWITFQSNRTGKWQVYRMRVDGTDLLQLTFEGENKEPDWSKKAE
jgi:TolB protein